MFELFEQIEKTASAPNIFLENLQLGDLVSASETRFTRFFWPLQVSQLFVLYQIKDHEFLKVLLPISLQHFFHLPKVQDFFSKKENWSRRELSFSDFGLETEHMERLAVDYLQLIESFRLRVLSLNSLFEAQYFPVTSWRDSEFKGFLKIKDKRCSLHFL